MGATTKQVKGQIKVAIHLGNKSGEALAPMLRAKAVAKVLGTSVRTMQRRLQEEETTFHEILDDIRKSLAPKLLTTFSVIEVGQMLGFSDRTGFRCAHIRWFGTNPSGRDNAKSGVQQ